MEDLTKKLIGTRINTALAAANLKQKDLAKELDVTDNTVSYWCNGTRTPNTDQIIQIARVLNISADYLLGLSDASTTDVNIKNICDYTGLSENAIINLSSLKKNELYQTPFNTFPYNPEIISVINFLLSDKRFFTAIDSLSVSQELLKGACDIGDVVIKVLKETSITKQTFCDYLKYSTPDIINNAIGTENYNQIKNTIDNVTDNVLYFKYDLSAEIEHHSIIDIALMRIDEMQKNKKFQVYEAIKYFEFLFDNLLSEDNVFNKRNEIIAYFQAGDPYNQEDDSECPQ